MEPGGIDQDPDMPFKTKSYWIRISSKEKPDPDPTLEKQPLLDPNSKKKKKLSGSDRQEKTES